VRKLTEMVLAAFERTGLHVGRLRSVVAATRRAETFGELEAMYRHFVFPELSTCEGRCALAARLEGTGTSEAIYLAEFLRRSSTIEGDVCEFGVAQGATSAYLANELRASDRHLWLFDSFEGLSRPTEQDVLVDDIFQLGAMEKYGGTMAYDRSHVGRRLREIAFPRERTHVVPGFIEKSLRSARLPERVCFAFVDFDLHAPIKAALEFLDGVVPLGGNVVVDDYGWFSSGAQTAVDDFVRTRRDRWSLEHPLPFAGRFVVLERRA
jgi:O-methyltransferase